MTAAKSQVNQSNQAINQKNVYFLAWLQLKAK